MYKMSVVGKNVRKLDSVEKVTGTANFTTDVELPGMLFGRTLRSPYPHARIVNIDTTAAEKLEGVKAVISYKNTSRVLFNTAATSTFTLPPMMPVLDQYIFDSVVRYVGDEVAAVAAVTEEIAERALSLIKVEYEILPAVFDPLEALKDEAPALHGECEAGKNIPAEKIHLEMGDVEKGFAEADFVFEHTFKVPVQKQTQMETQAAVAQVTKDGKITVYSTTQTPHPSRRILASIFEIPYSKVRVLNPPYVGGGFGVRIGLSAKAEPIAVALALQAKKPVKVVYTRTEDFIASDTRHPGYITVKTGVKKDGTLVSRKMHAILNSGAYCTWSGETPGVLGAMGLSMYRCENQMYDGHSVYTNTTPTGAMRGFGNPQAMFAIDSQMDIIAEELGIDALELRIKNMMRPGDKWVLPYQCQSTGLEECIKNGAEEIGWNQKGSFDNSGRFKRGIGVAVGTHVSNAWPFCGDYSNAYLTMQQDGSVNLAAGVPDLGTGTATTLAQMAAEVLGISFEKVSVTFGDTESTPFDIGSHASRTCYASGAAVVAAANEMKAQIFEYASKLLETYSDKIDIEEDHVYSTERPEQRISLFQVAERAHLAGIQFIGVGKVIPQNAPPYMAHFADVEVDTHTGQISVIKMVGVHDVGRAIHPQICEGQIEGGIVQGIGYALSEEVIYDKNGKQVNNNFHKYMIPTSMDVPEIKAILVESNDPSHPFGVKGVGETGLVPTAAAIANAVYNATGVRMHEIPITAERMFKAIVKNKNN